MLPTVETHAADCQAGACGHLDIIESLTGDYCHSLDDAGLLAGLGDRLSAARRSDLLRLSTDTPK
jgi:hypothetical protein